MTKLHALIFLSLIIILAQATNSTNATNTTNATNSTNDTVLPYTYCSSHCIDYV